MKLIKDSDLKKIRDLAERLGFFDELKNIDIRVIDTDMPDDYSDTNENLPCNCFAREDGGSYHSSECSSWFKNNQDGIIGYERFTGRKYKLAAK